MATTTPNFGWTVPTSSDLVKNGATAIETLGDAIDASLVDLKGGTTGQVLSKASNTDMDFTWGTAASGGGMTLLSTTTLSGATTTISSISQSYKELRAYVFGVTNATANGTIQVAPNGVTNKSVRCETYYISNPESLGVNGAGGGKINFTAGQSMLRTDASNAWVLTFPNYASTTSMKPYSISGGFFGTNTNENAFASNGFYFETTAISSLVFNASGGNLSTGTVLLYGVS